MGVTREEFLKQRMSGIGGTDISAILGLSPYKSALQLWLEKTGRDLSEPDSASMERMHWGTVLEDVVAKHYAEVTGSKIQRINQQMQHPDVAIARANIDRAVLYNGSRARWCDKTGMVIGAEKILEVKTAHAMAANGPSWGEPGTDEIPEHYWMQVQWYMGITGIHDADLAVLFGGQKFEIYHIEFDRDLFNDALAEADRWWQAHIVADLPPPAATEDDARRLWPSHSEGKEKIVDATVAEAVEKLQAIKAEIKELEQLEQQAKDTICSAFGDAEAITYMGRKLATWKKNRDGQRTNWKQIASDIKGWMIENEIEEGVDAVRDIIDSNTTETEGARVLRIAASKE
ncbi:MAG: YqaJ viral recombinase family protein [Thauera sp.]|jgi:putative phage-type endonuclease|nr:YqaJ viral recombinase family protein [Thauera sp.]